MLKALVIDDEHINRDNLVALLQKYCSEKVEVTGRAFSVKSGLSMIREKKPDLVFLDIELPDGTGFDILKGTHEHNYRVIFVTAFDSYAIKAIKFNALDYILKPIHSDELVDAVNKAIQQSEPSSLQENRNIISPSENAYHKIALPVQNGTMIFALSDIIRCEADDYYTRFYFSTRKPELVSKNLGYYDDLLSGNGFFRTHKSHLVNLTHLVKYVKGQEGFVILSDQSKIPVSKSRKGELLQKLGNL